MYFQMDLFILVNGINLEITKKALEYKYGQMGLNMKAFGIKVKHKVLVDLS